MSVEPRVLANQIVAGNAAAITEGLTSIAEGAGQTTRATYDLSTTSIASGVNTKLPWAFNYGTALLDLASPTDPTPVDSGVYSLAVRVQFAELTDPTVNCLATLTVDENDFGASVSSSIHVVGSTGSLSLTLPFYLPAGSPCYVTARHDNSPTATVTGSVQVQRLS